MKEKRSQEVIFRLTGKEYECLVEMARADPESRMRSGVKVNVSKYIRKCIFTPIGSTKDMKKEIKELSFQVRKIGVNINQVAKRINSGFLETDDTVYLLEGMKKVEGLLGDLLFKLGEDDGYNADDEY